MLPSYFDYIFVRLRQKARLRPELSPKFFVNFRLKPCPNPNPTVKARPDLQLCRAPLQRVHNLQERKNDTPLSFSKNAQIFLRELCLI